jgi:proline iminopeptidase
MGPLDSRRFDLEEARPALARLPYAPGPLNRAFGPDGFLRHFDLRPEPALITARP